MNQMIAHSVSLTFLSSVIPMHVSAHVQCLVYAMAEQVRKFYKFSGRTEASDVPPSLHQAADLIIAGQ